VYMLVHRHQLVAVDRYRTANVAYAHAHAASEFQVNICHDLGFATNRRFETTLARAHREPRNLEMHTRAAELTLSLSLKLILLTRLHDSATCIH